jgi:hypothetical protein
MAFCVRSLTIPTISRFLKFRRNPFSPTNRSTFLTPKFDSVQQPSNLLSSSSPKTESSQEDLILTDSCVERLKKICDENTYLRILVTQKNIHFLVFIFIHFHIIFIELCCARVEAAYCDWEKLKTITKCLHYPNSLFHWVGLTKTDRIKLINLTLCSMFSCFDRLYILLVWSIWDNFDHIYRIIQ